MNGILYSSFERKLIRNENMSFIKLLIEKDIKSYKYNIQEESITSYIEHLDNRSLYNAIKKFEVTDEELESLRESLLKNNKCSLEVEYLPTEDWEFDDYKEITISVPSYDMLSCGLALFILIFPFASLFLSYFLIMIFR